MISKTMNFFWGNEKMSWLRYMTLFSFKVTNPDWKIRLYFTEPVAVEKTWSEYNQQDFFAFVGDDVTEKILSLGVEIRSWELSNPELTEAKEVKLIGPSHKSNFFKWGLLAKESGFYADMDILFTSSLNDYYEKVKDVDVVNCFRNNHFSIGFLGSSGENKFYSDIFQHTYSSFNLGTYQSAGVMSIYTWLQKQPQYTGKYWEQILELYPQLKFYNNTMDFVYPWNWLHLEEVFEKKHTSLPEGCVGIHWYAGAVIAQEYNNLLSEDNLSKYDSTISYFAQKVLAGDA